MYRLIMCNCVRRMWRGCFAGCDGYETLMNLGWGRGVMEEALEEGEKRMRIILKQMTCHQELHKMVTTVCVNYTTSLLAAADPRGPTNWSCSPLRMLPLSEGVSVVSAVAKLPSSPVSKVAVENESYQTIRDGSMVTRSWVGGLDPLGLLTRQHDLFQPFPSLNFG